MKSLVWNINEAATMQEILKHLHDMVASACGRLKMRSLQISVQLAINCEYAGTHKLDSRDNIYALILRVHPSRYPQRLADQKHTIKQRTIPSYGATLPKSLQNLTQVLIEANKALQTAEPVARECDPKNIGAISRSRS